MEMTPVLRKFVLHWGEMGTRWGINRTVAQIHALLFTSPQPLTAEEIADALSVARSNVSTSLRELQSYGIVKIEYVSGSLKIDYHGLGGVLSHFHYDVFEVPKDDLNPFSQEKVQFRSNLAGEIESLGIPFESTLKDITFIKLGDRSMTQKTFLQPLIGDYQRGPLLAAISLKGDSALTLTLPGQPVCWLCTSAIALMIGAGPHDQPMRQPVMA